LQGKVEGSEVDASRGDRKKTTAKARGGGLNTISGGGVVGLLGGHSPKWQ